MNNPRTGNQRGHKEENHESNRSRFIPAPRCQDGQDQTEDAGAGCPGVHEGRIIPRSFCDQLSRIEGVKWHEGQLRLMENQNAEYKNKQPQQQSEDNQGLGNL